MQGTHYPEPRVMWSGYSSHCVHFPEHLYRNRDIVFGTFFIPSTCMHGRDMV